MTKRTKRTIIDFFSNHNLRSFIVCLLITVVVWTLMSLSESKSVRHTHPLQFTGYDKNKYAITADTAIMLEINGSGFELLKTAFWKKVPEITIDLKGMRLRHRNSIATADLEKEFLSQLKLYENQTIHFGEDSVVFFLNARNSKRVKVDISGIDFEFSPQYGIYGNPTVTPDSVTIYGDSNALAEIKTVGVVGKKISNIETDSTYTVDLQPVWKQYSDVYPSVKKVKIRLSVERFTEASYTVPIDFVFRDTSVHAKVYPPTAEITCKVALKDYKRITPEMFRANVFCENLHRQDTLSITVSQFPKQVRISKIKPEYVQYVIIR
ncbi:MAG: YbbR-like domain-containing protein [Bacteroidales bacterium]|nr:YbbR-like domain-containing protein [Bacteroidales bacterium]